MCGRRLCRASSRPEPRHVLFGATHNSVANAALIGVAVTAAHRAAGRQTRKEYNNPRALVVALAALAGVGMPCPANLPWRRVDRGNVSAYWQCFSGRPTSCRPTLPTGTWTSLPSCPRLVRSGLWRCFDWRSRTETVRHERHGMDLHADPHVPHRGRRTRADGRRAEVDPDRTIGIAQVDQPALAVVWSLLLLGDATPGRSSISPSSSADCWALLLNRSGIPRTTEQPASSDQGDLHSASRGRSGVPWVLTPRPGLSRLLQRST